MQDSSRSDQHVVTAVLVAHNGARWLPETLKALLTQTRPVQRLVAVDTGSHDRGPAVLSEVVGEGDLITLPATTGYGQAIAKALAHPAASLATETSGGTEWIWLLHDDSIPAHDALDRLLDAAGGDPGIAVLGPKLRDLGDRRLLLEIGITVDGFGRRETGVERGELDQGQHDARVPTDVLAVSSAGMLIRRDVWDRLGGFDPRLGLFRDDLDLGWRAHAAGHRVVAVSEAVVYHAEAAGRGLREIDAVPGVSPARLDRRNALFVLLANLPLRSMLRALARNVTGSLVRAAGLAIAKRPQAARDELLALTDVLLGVRALWQGRAKRRHNRKHVYHSIRRYMARRVVLRRIGERLADILSGDLPWPRRELMEDEPESESEEETASLLRRALHSPGVLLVLGLTVVSGIACRRLIGTGGQLGGGALVPAWGGAGDLWRQYLAGWHPVGLGSNASAPPYVGILALASTVVFGKAWLVVSVLLLGAVPLAGLSAYLAAHVIIPDDYLGSRPRRKRGAVPGRKIPAWVLRVWAAATYALLPVVTGAIAAGRIGTIVVLIVLPQMAVLAARMIGVPRRARARLTSRQAAWGTGLLLAVATAFVPFTWLLAVLVGVLVWTAFGPAGRGGDLAVALLLPLGLLFPWAIGLLLHPSRFLLEAGLHRPELSDARLPTRDLMFLIPGGPGDPVWWGMAGLLAAALLALPLRGRQNVVLAGWMLALFGVLAAILVSALRISQGPDTARAWPGVALLFASAGLLLAATATVQRSAELLVGRDWIFRIGAGVVALVALSAPFIAAGFWVLHGVHGPVARVSGDLTGTLASETEAGSHQDRTLVLTRRPGEARVTYTVLRATAPSLGESETPTSAAARRRMDSIVAGFAAGHGDGWALARMGVQYVYVPNPRKDAIVPELDSAPDLARLGRDNDFALWRLVPQSGRLLLIDGTQVTALSAGATGASVKIPPGGAGRTLLLTEPSDGGWRAALDGAVLRPQEEDGWAVGYKVPASGGRLVLSHGMWSHHVWLVVQGLLVVIAVIAALPSPEDELVRRRASVRRAEQLRSRAARASATAGAAARSRAGSGARTVVRSVREAAARRRAVPPPRDESVDKPVDKAVDEAVAKADEAGEAAEASGVDDVELPEEGEVLS